MAQIFELEAAKRLETGKAAARRIRHQENIPAILYGADLDPLPLTLLHNKVIKALENEAFYSHILTLDIEGKKERAVLRDIQRHPYKPKIVHLDFQRISEHEKLTMNVPIHFIGAEVAPGVVDEGGTISHLLTNVEVYCLPANLPEYIEVDIAHLKLDETLHLSDIKLPSGVEFYALSRGHSNDLPVVTIHLPRAAYAEEASAATEEGATGEEEGAAPAAEAEENKES